MVRAKLDIALWSGLYVIYNSVVSFDLRCQSGFFPYNYMIFVVYYSSPVPVFECPLIFVLINAFVHVAILLKMVQ